MIRFVKKPSDTAIVQYIRHCQTLDFNYPYVGQTRNLIDSGEAPKGYRLDRFSHLIGYGEEVFNGVADAINQWEMFNHPMAELKYLNPKIENGNTVVVVFGSMGLWTVNPARIIYELAESRQQGKIRQAGFAYGTTMGHIAIGEELFHVDWNQKTDEVNFRITVFSRPGSLLAWIGKPCMAYQQKKFRRLAAQAILTKSEEFS
ncbi:MAG: hypothetical protein CMJ76_03460 [Planctomycetaceae bacterium]|nr:hypothetical protein [Planctomycetaceae bacterium]|tara:strand:- start:1832 stop:2440 length:609 start_codon:yes stop_codon:yes gene_type:complete